MSPLRDGNRCFVPLWALEVFDWWQICKKFHVAQLLYVSVNFQMFNCMTPAGFVKDSGETLHTPRGLHGQGQLRYGWNIPVAADHFLSCPSAVVAHRSPLGVAGVPPSVATVRGTAGPEPLAMTPMVSEKDSCVVLPLSSTQAKPQWTLEVDPGEYIVVVTVGDRNVGFSAYLEVGDQPIFSGEWIEAGNFKSRCIRCAAHRGAITVGPCWPRSGHRTADHRDDCICSDTLAGEAMSCGVRHDSPPLSPQAGSPRGTRAADGVVKGTRLVSLRVVAVPLAREVERERRSMFAEINQKLMEAWARVESIKQAVQASQGGSSLERELAKGHSKVSELQVQKALKLFSMVGLGKRVPHPYIYLNGEVSSVPPVEHTVLAEQERPT